MSRTVSRLISGITVLLFLALAWTGIRGGLDQLSKLILTRGQQVQSVAQLAYGVLSLFSLVVWFWARRWSRPVFIGWAASLALAGGLAAVVWGVWSVGVGLLSGVASFLIAGVMVWLLRFSARRAA